MDRFYFVRHGQTDANLAELAAGSGWDIELNETGLAQALALAESEALRACRGVKTICASPLARARQTAETINKVLQAQIVIIDDLKEWHLGEWERRSWNELPNIYHPNSDPPGGETQNEFSARVEGAFAFALTHPGPVLIVAHGGVWDRIARHLELPRAEINNCELKQVRRDHMAASWTLEKPRLT